MVQLFDMYTGGRGTISLQYNNKKRKKQLPDERTRSSSPICDGNGRHICENDDSRDQIKHCDIKYIGNVELK